MKNKYNSVHVQKKWKNKHAFKYCGYRFTSYGYGYATPPLSRNLVKQRRKDKTEAIRQYANESIQIGWIDHEIVRDNNFQRILTQSDDTDNDNWICQSCTMENTIEFQFCCQCNAPYHGYDQNQYRFSAMDSSLYWKQYFCFGK